MLPLNFDLAAPPMWLRPFFMNLAWRRVTLPPGLRLAKFTEIIRSRRDDAQYDLFGGGDVTPWWALDEPAPELGDPGLQNILDELRARGEPLAESVRDRYAVKHCWNGLENPATGLLRVLHATLLEPVVGFHGRIAPVGEARASSADPRPDHDFKGGGYQLYIPNMTGAIIIGDGIDLLH